MTKRSFYEDDDYIVNKPGTITAITSELAEKNQLMEMLNLLME